MTPTKSSSLIPAECIERSILFIREHKVMLDRDLADLYQVKPIALRQQMKRNKERFPKDFMFQAQLGTVSSLRSQTYPGVIGL